MIPDQRREHILKLLQERHVLSINELTSMLSVSHMTVRRDIQALENDGKVLSVTGGVRLAARLLDHALGLAGRPVVADVQSHLVAWYARFGFTADGPEFVMDGIPHVPMRLA
jgi:DeoR/GlpR family transcriptional regulator of sugar metabolism